MLPWEIPNVKVGDVLICTESEDISFYEVGERFQVVDTRYGWQMKSLSRLYITYVCGMFGKWVKDLPAKVLLEEML